VQEAEPSKRDHRQHGYANQNIGPEYIEVQFGTSPFLGPAGIQRTAIMRLYHLEVDAKPDVVTAAGWWTARLLW